MPSRQHEAIPLGPLVPSELGSGPGCGCVQLAQAPRGPDGLQGMRSSESGRQGLQVWRAGGPKEVQPEARPGLGAS